MIFSRRVFRLALPAPLPLFAALAAPIVPRAAAQSQVLVFDTLFQAQDLSQWGTGGASGVDYSVDLSTSWNTSTPFGSFSTGLFGDEWGAGGTASTSGNVGFNASFSTNGGSLDVYIPNRIRLEAPSENSAAQPTITITQDRGGLGANDLFQATFPSVSFALGFHATVDARVEGRVAYGVGSTSGAITLQDLFAAFNPTLYAASKVTGLDPFDFDIDLLEFNGSSSTLTLAGKSIHVTNGINKDITTADVVPVENSDTLVPVRNRLGAVRIDPFLSDLNVHSGSSLSTTASDTSVFGASIDALGLVSAAFGLPINPFDIRANIPGTPLNVQFQTLSLNPHLDLGLKQTLSLAPHTYLSLTSNYDVTYLVNGQQITTKNLHYLLPDDASLASSLQILTRPTQEDWQLFSSIYADPQLHNQLYLSITGGLDIEALKARISAYGAGVGFGPLFDLDPSYTQDILIYDQLINLEGGTLSRVYRNPIPLFGAGVLQDLQLDQPDDAIVLLSHIGTFGLTELRGELTLRDSYFQNTTPLTLSGLLHLDVAPSPLAANSTDPSVNQFETPTLALTATGVLRIDPNSLLTVNGLRDAESHDILDAHGNRQLGFITPLGADQGAIDAGTFFLGGTLRYDGPWITRIGADAHIELLPSSFTDGAGTYADLGRRFDNYHGAVTSDGAVDGLSHLDTLAGTLVIAGQDLSLYAGLTHSGSLTVTGGYTLTAAGKLTNTGSGRIAVGPDSLVSFVSLDSSNLDAGTLTLAGLDLTLGGAAGQTAGIFRYGGSRPTTLAASTQITLSGSRPDIGYFQGGLNANTDALADLTANAGTFVLQNGATQTVGGATSGGFNNTGLLTVAGAGSALTVNGAFANTGTLTLSDTGALTATGTLVNLGGASTLTGGVWNLGGTLTYAGSGITAIAAGTTVTLTGSGNINNGGNALAGLATIGGAFALGAGATVTTNSALTVNGSLTVADGATLAAAGLDLHGALALDGTLRNTGAAVTTLADDASVTVRGAGALQNASAGNGWAGLATIAGTLDLADGGTVRTDAALTFASGAQVLLGRDGVLQAAGATLTLVDGNALVQNGGTLILGGNAGSTTTLDLADGFSLGNLTLQLGTGGATAGSLAADSNVSWTVDTAGRLNGAGAISGGALTNRGHLDAVGGTLTLSGFASPLVNAGHLGSFTDTRGAGNLVLDAVTLVNHDGATSGSIDAFAGLTLLDGTTVTGGSVNVYAGGSLTVGNVSLELGDFDANGTRTTVGTLALDGAMTVLQGKNATVTAATVIGASGALTLQGGDETHDAALLTFGAGSSLANRGTVNLGSGAAITGALLNNYGTVNLTSGLVHLDNIANGAGGTVNLLNGSTLNFDVTTFENAGLIHLSGEDPAALANSHSTFLLTQDLTLTGGGTLQLGGYNTSTSPNAANVNLASTTWTDAGSGTLVSSDGSGGAGHHVLTLENQQIVGRGDFGQGTLSLVSRADSSIGVYGDGSVLNIETDSGGFLNEGALNVDVGATMNISGGPFLSLDENGYLVKGSYRVGGTLVITGLAAGAFDSSVALTFEGDHPLIRNENGDTIQVRNNLAGGALTVANGTYIFATDASHPFTNQGLLRAAAGGTLSLTGDHFTNYDAATHTLAGGDYESAGTFKFDGANIQTLAAGTSLTIRETSAGIGQFTDENGQDALRNFTANHGTFSLQGGADYTFNAGITSFTNDGKIHVGADTYLNLNQAALTHTANSDWWVAGNVSGGSGFSTTGKVTLFGPFAAIQSPGYTMDDGTVNHTTSGTTEDGHPYTTTGSPVVSNEGHLVYAGGYSATYSNGDFATGATVYNNGLWEIGSPTAVDADGNVIGSAASVSFTGGGAGAYAARIINSAAASVRYYGAMGNSFGSLYYSTPRTSDGTSGSFKLDHLIIQGGSFDATGLINVNAGGTFALQDATLRNTQGKLTVQFATPGGTFDITGGLDLTHPINIINGTLNYSRPVSGNYPVAISGFDLYLPGYNYAAADYTLRDNARFVDAGGLSAIRNIQTNSHTVTFDHANGNVGSHFTYDLAFANYGTINAIGSSVSFGSDLDNHGTLSTSQNGVFGVAGDLNNYATLAGQISVAGDLFSYGGTLAAGGIVQGNLYLDTGTTVPLNGNGTSSVDALAVGGYVQSYIPLTLSGLAFRRADGTYAPIYNLSTLTLNGTLYNNLIQTADSHSTIHTSGDVTLYGDNTNLAGQVYVDQGSLSASSNTSIGTATLNLASGTTLVVGPYTLPNPVNATGNVTLSGGAAGGALTGPLNGTALTSGTVTVGGNLTLSSGQFNALTLASANLTLKAPLLTLNGPVSGTGTLNFFGDARPIGFDGGNVDLYGDLTVQQFSLATATGSPRLTLHGGAATSLTADIVNPGITGIATGSDLTLGGILSGNGTLEIGSVYSQTPTRLTLTRSADVAATTVNVGATLTLRPANEYQTPLTGTIVNGGTLVFASDYAYTQPAGQTFTGYGNYIKQGTGTLTLLDATLLGGPQSLAIDAGTVRVGDGAINLTGTLGSSYAPAATLAAGATLAFQNAGNAALYLAGAGRFDNLGSGTTTLLTAGGLSGVNQFGSGILALPSGSAINGPVTVGIYGGNGYAGYTNTTAGTLLITDDTSLGAAPATFTPAALALGAGSTLKILSPTTLAATRGVTFSDATIDTNGVNLTIPSALNGYGTLTKTGYGTLSLLLPANSLGFAVGQGALILNNDNGYTYSPASLTVDADAAVTLAGGGYYLGAANASLAGVTTIAAGAELRYEGADAPGDFIVAGTFITPNTGRSFGAFVNTGALTFGYPHDTGTTTVAAISGAGTVTLTGEFNLGNLVGNPDRATLVVTGQLGTGTFNLGDETVLQTGGGAIGTLDLGAGYSHSTVSVDPGGLLSVGTLLGPANNPGNTTLDKTGDGTLAFDGAGDLPGIKMAIAAGTLLGANGTTFSGLISGDGGFTAGYASLTGDVTLSADNTYTGGTTVLMGRLILGQGGTTGSVTGDIAVNSWGTLAFNRSDTYTLANTLTGQGGLEQLGPGTLVLNSDLSWTDDADPDHPLTYARPVTITGGALRLDDGVAGLGTITDRATLVFNNAGALTLDYAGLFGDAKTITGNGTVTQAGAGTTTLGGINDWTGATAVNAGRLVFTSDFANTGGSTVAAGATLALDGAGTIGGVIANAGTIALDRSDTYLAGFSTTGAGTVVKSGAGDAILTSTAHTNRFDIETGRLGFNASADGTFAAQLAGPGRFFQSGSGTLTLTGGTWDTLGGIDIDTGSTLRLAGGDYDTSFAVATGGVLSLAQDLNFSHGISGGGRLVIEDGHTLNLTGSATQGYTTINPGATLALADGSTLAGTITNNGVIAFNNLSPYTFTGTASGVGSFLIADPGRVELTGDSSLLTGGATITAGGHLALSGAGSVGGTIANAGILEIVTAPGTSRLIPANITGAGNLALSGGGAIEIAGDLTYSGLTTLSDGTTLNAFINDGDTTTFSSLITGTGNLVKSGPGTLVIARSSTFNGDVTINAGTLEISDNGYLFGNTLTVNGTLAYNYNTTPQTITAPIAGSGGLRQMGSKTLTIDADLSGFVGTTTVDAGRTLVFGANGLVGGALVVDGTLYNTRDAALTLPGLTGGADGLFSNSSAQTLTLSGPADFAGSLVTAGALVVPLNAFAHRLDRVAATSLSNSGQLVITGDNPANTGLTVTNDGTLTLGNGGAAGRIGDATNGIVNTGTLAINRSTALSLGYGLPVWNSADHVDSGLGAIRNLGSGKLTLDGPVTASSVAALGSGALEIMNPASAGSASIVIGASGTGLLHDGTYANLIHSSGTLQTSGTVSLTNVSNTYSGDFEIVSGSAGIAGDVFHNATIGGLLGTGTLNFTDTGTLTLNRSTLSGAINTTGSLITAKGSIATDVNFANGGTLRFNHADAATFSGRLTATSVLDNTALELNGPGDFTLDSDLRASPGIKSDTPVSVSGGSLILGANGDLASLTLADGTSAHFSDRDLTLTNLNGAGTVSHAGNLSLSQGVFSGSITGTTLTKSGSGAEATFSGEVDFDSITASSGRLTLSGSSRAETYTVGSTLALGPGTLGAHAAEITLTGGRLETLGATTFAANQNIVLSGGGTLAGDLQLTNAVTGNGTLQLAAGRAQFNSATAYTGSVVVGNGATFALGNPTAIDISHTTFNAGSNFDLYGHDWSAGFSAENVTLLNTSLTPVTVTSTLDVGTHFGLGGTGSLLSFLGAVNASGSVDLRSDGQVLLGDTAAASIGSLTVSSGNLSASTAALSTLTSATLQDAGGLTFINTGGTLATDLTFQGGVDNHASLRNDSGSPVTINGRLTMIEGDPTRQGTALIGGSGDLTLNGSIGGGELSLTKVGAGNLTLNSTATTADWNTANGGARLGVREGTLTTTTAILMNRGLVVEDTGTLVLTDTDALTLRSLDGNGNLTLTTTRQDYDFGSGQWIDVPAPRDLVMNLASNGSFTGSLTAGNVTSNVANIGSGAPTQTFGTLTATSLTVNLGNVVIIDALNVGLINVYASGAGGSLTTTTNGLSTDGGTNLSGYLNLQGEMRLTGGSGVTANSGGITLDGAQARLLDDQGATDTLSHIATNTGQISLSYGASVTAGAATFTNTGRVDLGSTTWSGLHNVVNQASLSEGFFLNNSVLSVESFTQVSGPLVLSADSTIIGTAGGDAATNPVFVMTGGQFDAGGTISGGLELAGGLTRLGAFYSVGTLTAEDGAVLAGGARLQWTFDSSNSDHHSLLAVTAGAAGHDGLLTVTASGALPVLVDLMSTGSTLPDFDATQSRTWTFATTTDGLAGFDSAKFVVTNSDVGAGDTGNFGLIANGLNVDLVYNPSQVYNTTSGDVTVSTPVAASGPFGGIYTYGSGTLTLAAANTYTGDTTLATGTLALGDDHALGAGALRVGYGSTFLQAAGGPRTIANPIYLLGSPTINGGDDLTFTGSLTNVTTGNLTLSITNTGATTFGDIVLSSTSDAYTRTGRSLTLNIAAAAGLTTVAGTISDGLLAGGKLTKSGAGTLILAGENTYTGITNVNAGTLQLGDGGASGSILGDVAIGAGATLAFNRSDEAAFHGALSGGGGVIQRGTGALTLTGASTYTGATTVQSGTLIVNGSIASSSLITVNSGATLGGSGTIGATAINSGATIAPGNSPGLLTVDGDLTLAGLARMELAGLLRGTSYDAIDVDGSITFGGTLDVVLLGTFSPSGSSTFNLFNWTGAGTGWFTDVHLPDLAAGLSWNTDELYTSGVISVTGSAIPEPSTYAALIGACVLGLAILRKRRAG